MSCLNETLTMKTAYDSYRRPITFALLVPVSIASLICSIFILGFFFTRWNLMIQKSLHHHAVFILIVLSFFYTAFDLPFSMNYLRVGHHWYRSIPFCLWWYWFDYTIATSCLTIAFIASVQRHVLVFHSHWLQVRNKRFFLHYLPLLTCLVYSAFFYIILMFAYPCQLYYNPSEGWCAYPCYMDDQFLYNLDWFLNIVVWVCLVFVANVALLMRTVHSMRRIRHQQHNVWKRQRKLTLQLFSFTSLYFIVFIPTTTVAMLRNYLLPNLYSDVPNIYNIYHMFYFLCPLQPFFCIFALPEVMNFLKHRAHQTFVRSTVAPSTLARTGVASVPVRTVN